MARQGLRPADTAANRLHGVDGAAEYLCCGRRLIYRLVAERKVKSTYAGRCLRFRQSDLDAYLDARAVAQGPGGRWSKVRPGPIAAFEEGTVGWLADRGAFVLPDGREAPFRITMVLHREDCAWKIVQEHASIGVRNEEALGVEL
jgi:excisionase family DNA binding protein